MLGDAYGAAIVEALSRYGFLVKKIEKELRKRREIRRTDV
jgi:hypothetical protein